MKSKCKCCEFCVCCDANCFNCDDCGCICDDNMDVTEAFKNLEKHIRKMGRFLN